MAVRTVTILGSTGSVGVTTLDVVARFPDRFRVVAMAAGRSLDLLADQRVIDARHQDDLGFRAAPVQAGDHVEPRHAGQAEIGEHQVDGILVQQFQAGFGIAGGESGETLLAQIHFEQAPHFRFVFDDQDRGHESPGICLSASGAKAPLILILYLAAEAATPQSSPPEVLPFFARPQSRGLARTRLPRVTTALNPSLRRAGRRGNWRRVPHSGPTGSCRDDRRRFSRRWPGPDLRHPSSR